MRFIIFLGLSFFTSVFVTSAQIPRPQNEKCHVYIVDVLLAQKAQKEFATAKQSDYPNLKIKYKDVETMFPFEAEVSEEVQTTKHFAFPNSKMFITASVFYTDEMMASETGPDSITLGLFVSANKPVSAIGLQNVGNIVADIAYNTLTSKVRVKHYVMVDGKKYLVGLECEPKISLPECEKP